MLNQIKLEKYADILLWGLKTSRKGHKIGRYETVLVRYDMDALPLAEALYKKLLEQRLHVLMRANPSPGMEKAFFAEADKRQLEFRGPGDMETFSGLNGYILLRAPRSLTHLKDADPGKIAAAAKARKFMREIMDRRDERGLFSWTLCSYPTEELARQAKMNLAEYSAQVEKACFLNEKDPVKKWESIYENCTEIKKWLYGLKIKTLRLQSKSMDLEILLGEKRRFLGLSGHNIPSFEVFTSPDWRGTRGVYYADFPSFMSGNYVQGVRLDFSRGSAVKISAKQGDAFVKKMLGMDAGASRIGEFSLTDTRFSKIDRFMADTLYDENVGGAHGNCHVAVGSSYSDSYDGDNSRLTKEMKERLGFNASSLHWDLVNVEDKRVTAVQENGKSVCIYEKGKFRY